MTYNGRFDVFVYIIGGTILLSSLHEFQPFTSLTKNWDEESEVGLEATWLGVQLPIKHREYGLIGHCVS